MKETSKDIEWSIRKDIIGCGTIENMSSNRVEWKSRTCKADPHRWDRATMMIIAIGTTLHLV